MKFKNRRKRALITGILLFLATWLLASCRGQEQPLLLNSNSERLHYLQSLGWQLEESPVSEQTVVLPREFPTVLQEYNKLQLAHGYDLSPYAGKEVQLYTYRVLNSPNGEVSYCCIYLYRGRLIGGDIHSTSLTGFITGLSRAENG